MAQLDIQQAQLVDSWNPVGLKVIVRVAILTALMDFPLYVLISLGKAGLFDLWHQPGQTFTQPPQAASWIAGAVISYAIVYNWDRWRRLRHTPS